MGHSITPILIIVFYLTFGPLFGRASKSHFEQLKAERLNIEFTETLATDSLPLSEIIADSEVFEQNGAGVHLARADKNRDYFFLKGGARYVDIDGNDLNYHEPTEQSDVSEKSRPAEEDPKYSSETAFTAPELFENALSNKEYIPETKIARPVLSDIEYIPETKIGVPESIDNALSDNDERTNRHPEQELEQSDFPIKVNVDTTASTVAGETACENEALESDHTLVYGKEANQAGKTGVSSSPTVQDGVSPDFAELDSLTSLLPQSFIAKFQFLAQQLLNLNEKLDNSLFFTNQWISDTKSIIQKVKELAAAMAPPFNKLEVSTRTVTELTDLIADMHSNLPSSIQLPGLDREAIRTSVYDISIAGDDILKLLHPINFQEATIFLQNFQNLIYDVLQLKEAGLIEMKKILPKVYTAVLKEYKHQVDRLAEIEPFRSSSSLNLGEISACLFGMFSGCQSDCNAATSKILDVIQFTEVVQSIKTALFKIAVEGIMPLTGFIAPPQIDIELKGDGSEKETDLVDRKEVDPATAIKNMLLDEIPICENAETGGSTRAICDGIAEMIAETEHEIQEKEAETIRSTPRRLQEFLGQSGQSNQPILPIIDTLFPRISEAFALIPQTFPVVSTLAADALDAVAESSQFIANSFAKTASDLENALNTAVL